MLEQNRESRRPSRDPIVGDEGSGMGARSWDESTERHVTGREWYPIVADAREDAGVRTVTRTLRSAGNTWSNSR